MEDTKRSTLLLCAALLPTIVATSYLCTGVVWGGGTQPLGLGDLLKQVRKNHPQLSFARAKLSGLKGVSKVSGAWPNLRLTYQREQLFPAVGQDMAGVQLQLPLGGRTFRKKDVAKAHVAHQRAYLTWLSLQTKLRFLRVYFQRERLLQQIALGKSMSAQFKRLRGVLAARVTGGREAAMALLRFDLELEQQRQRRQRTSEQARALAQKLSRWSGVPMARILTSRTSLVPPSTRSSGTPGKGTPHPLLQYLTARLAVQKAQLKLAQAKAWPDLSLSLAYLRQEASIAGQPDSHGFMVGATLPLPLFQRNQAGVRRARLQLTLARRLYQRTLHKLQRQRKIARKRWSQSKARLTRFKKKLLKQLPKLLNAAQVAFRGGGPFTSFLSTYRSVERYQRYGLTLKHELRARSLALKEALGDVSSLY